MSLIRKDGFLPKMRSPSLRRNSIVSVLDIGTSKTCCLIARLTPTKNNRVLRRRTHQIEVLGIGVQRSRGIKSGIITDLDAAENSIRLAVDAAERKAGLTVDSLIVNVSAGRLTSEAFSADISLEGQAVRDKEIGHVLKAGGEHALAPDRSVLHSIPIGYSLDGNHSIEDPRGMVGNRLGVDMHVVTAENAPLHNLEICINRAHLSVEALVATPYAAGLATLVDDEAELGCACIDIGGGTTSLSIFMNGHFVHAEAIAVGGQHVTMDLARGLSISPEEAERIKIKHGSALRGNSDEMISIAPLNMDEGEVSSQIPRSELERIIRPRVEEIIELVRGKLANSGFAEAVGKRLVLTGGASQLNGLNEVARRLLANSVRMGRPLGITGLPEPAKGAAFSTAAGLLIYSQYAALENIIPGTSNLFSHMWSNTEKKVASGGGGNRFARLGSWLRESL